MSTHNHRSTFLDLEQWSLSHGKQCRGIMSQVELVMMMVIMVQVVGTVINYQCVELAVM